MLKPSTSRVRHLAIPKIQAHKQMRKISTPLCSVQVIATLLNQDTSTCFFPYGSALVVVYKKSADAPLGYALARFG